MAAAKVRLPELGGPTRTIEAMGQGWQTLPIKHDEVP
jgi:hypothetical protein